MADKLVVNIGDLRYTSSTLKELVTAFDDSKDIADGYQSYLGSGTLADAVGDFGSDWSYHKKKIVESMKSVQQMAESAAETYSGADDQLASGLQKDASSQGHSVRVAQ